MVLTKQVIFGKLYKEKWFFCNLKTEAQPKINTCLQWHNHREQKDTRGVFDLDKVEMTFIVEDWYSFTFRGQGQGVKEVFEVVERPEDKVIGLGSHQTSYFWETLQGEMVFLQYKGKSTTKNQDLSAMAQPQRTNRH